MHVCTWIMINSAIGIMNTSCVQSGSKYYKNQASGIAIIITMYIFCVET